MSTPIDEFVAAVKGIGYTPGLAGFPNEVPIGNSAIGNVATNFTNKVEITNPLLKYGRNIFLVEPFK